MKNIVDFYYKKNYFIYFLVPFSFVYRLVVFLRKKFYEIGLLKSVRFKEPVIIVGNITLGGTGKTPFVIWLANLLKQQGYQPGIVSRGYGAQTKDYPKVVKGDSNPNETGDEPFLIATNTNCPVVIDPKRTRAVELLLKKHDCDIVISDDGLQHYALERDIEIIIIDGQRYFGNQFCIPAGPLREPLNRLDDAHHIVINGGGVENSNKMNLIPQQLVNLKTGESQSLEEFEKRTVHAVAGIGNPKRFFDLLRDYKINVIEHPFRDHFSYSHKDVQFLKEFPIIMTEKDAVKCRDFASEKCWYLPVTAKLSEQFEKQLVEDIHRVKSKRERA